MDLNPSLQYNFFLWNTMMNKSPAKAERFIKDKVLLFRLKGEMIRLN
jgi:hypothetical protein